MFKSTTNKITNFYHSYQATVFCLSFIRKR